MVEHNHPKIKISMWKTMIVFGLILGLRTSWGMAQDDGASFSARRRPMSPCAQFLQQHNLGRLMALAEKTFNQALQQGSGFKASSFSDASFSGLAKTGSGLMAARMQQASLAVWQELATRVKGLSVALGQDLANQPFFTVRIDRPTGLRDYVRFFLREKGEKSTLWYEMWTEELGETPTLDLPPQKIKLVDTWPTLNKILTAVFRGNTALPLAVSSFWRLKIKTPTLAAVEQEIDKLLLGTTLKAQVFMAARSLEAGSVLRLAIPFAHRNQVQILEVKILAATEAGREEGSAGKQEGELPVFWEITPYEISAQTPYHPTDQDLYYGLVRGNSLFSLGVALGQMIGWILAMPQGDGMVDPWRPKMVQEIFGDYHRHYHF